MLKIKAVFYNVYNYIYRKAETLSRWTQEVNRGQPELVRVLVENSGAQNSRETFD